MRQTDSLRSLVRETRLTPANFIYPLFVCPGEGVRKEISSMPGVFNISVDEAVKEAREAKQLGLGGIILFGLPEKKDEVATGAWADDGIVQRATRAIKREVRDLVVIGDVCLCEYMSHGHCGIVQKKSAADGERCVGEAGKRQRRKKRRGNAGRGGSGIRNPERPHAGNPGQDRGLTGQGRHGYYCSIRHDGRPRRLRFAKRWTRPAS